MKSQSFKLAVNIVFAFLVIFISVICVDIFTNDGKEGFKNETSKLADSIEILIDQDDQIVIKPSDAFKSIATGEIILGTTSEIAAKQALAIKDAEEKAIEEEKKRIVYDNLTFEQLTAKINRVFKNTYLKNTGQLFAKLTLEKGVDTYTAISIVLLETGCKWTCSRLTRQCNNVGGMKGSPSCSGSSFKKFNTLEEGITSFVDNLSRNYFKKGLDTPEKMGNKYANGSKTWSGKVNKYIDEVKKI